MHDSIYISTYLHVVYYVFIFPSTLPPSYINPPPLSVLSPQYIGATFQDAFIVALISFSIGVSLSRIIHAYTLGMFHLTMYICLVS